MKQQEDEKASCDSEVPGTARLQSGHSRQPFTCKLRSHDIMHHQSVYLQ